MTSYRLDKGGLIDRESALRFTFDGALHIGRTGDTLASAPRRSFPIRTSMRSPTPTATCW